MFQKGTTMDLNVLTNHPIFQQMQPQKQKLLGFASEESFEPPSRFELPTC